MVPSTPLQKIYIIFQNKQSSLLILFLRIYTNIAGPKGVEFKQRPHSTAANVTGYQAILASATNNGKTFNTLINMTDQGVYFNQISCIDSQNCW